MEVPANVSLRIRPATGSDARIIHGLICELAEFERLSHEVVATEEAIRQTLSRERNTVEVLLAERNGQCVAFALFFPTYSTFLAQDGVYLEDVFVRESERGQGIGRRLMVEVARIAADRNYGRFEWSVLNWNTVAIDFYRKLGAVALDEWTRFRLSGDSIRKLAESADGE